jgi:uncharacterized protein YbjT (DUF2867 family)
MYAIAGVTGNTGSVAAETLLAQGKPVRVIVRDAAKGAAWRQKGAEVAVAALDDAAALTQALTGVEGVYLLIPPDLTTADPLGKAARFTQAYVDAITAAKVPHVVLLSSVGAQHPDGTGPIQYLHRAEAALAGTGTALTALRPAYFQENIAGSLGSLATGTVYTFLPNDLAFPQIATKDIGKAAALALVEGQPAGTKRVIELAGPADVSGNDVQAALRRITGKDINVVAAPLDAVVPTFTGFGMSAALAALYQEMYAAIMSGRVAYEGAPVKGTTTFETTLGAILARNAS